MTVMEAIRGRRSIRGFLAKPIPDEALDALMDAVVWAPSAGNLQSRFFHFVRDKKTKQKIASYAFGQMFIASAPLVVVASADLDRVRHYGRRGVELYAVQDVAAAVENLMLQAFELGLGSVWVGAFDPAGVRDSLGMGPNLAPHAVVPIGYPAAVPDVGERLDRDELIKVVE